MYLVVYAMPTCAPLINFNLIVDGIFFLGYPQGKKGWYLFDLDNHQFFLPGMYNFESQFPFHSSTSTVTETAEIKTSDSRPAHLLFDDANFHLGSHNSSVGPSLSSSPRPNTLHFGPPHMTSSSLPDGLPVASSSTRPSTSP